jgi:hypothetical protein
MSGAPKLGRYHFQAWARRGIAASLDKPDGGGSLPSRASLKVQIQLDVQGGGAPNPVLPPATTVKLYGPGDIAAIDPRMVIRTEPRQFTVNFEPNYLCGIEFDTPDFPWLFTPASPNGDRLRPWLALIVLKQQSEFSLPSLAPNPLPTVLVQTTTALQDLSDGWNWAHVQISGDASLADSLKNAPGNVISRLLCPRRLDPETSYTAFLVPAFQNGVKAGLGQDVSSVATSDPAWSSSTQAPLTLPYYFRFDFNTSDEGDFESLVRALTPRVLPPTVGQRPMDVSQPDPSVPSAGGPLGLDGALESIGEPETHWSSADKDAFQTAVQTWINQTAPATDDPASPNPNDPVVVPPIYGRWQAAATSVNRTAAGWLNDLNLDPRNRTAAGMGTQIVQREQTQLMASAWDQVDGVLRANRLLKQAQLARSASQQLYRQHFAPAQTETLLNFTAPLHSRLLAGPTTVTAQVRASRVPERMFSGAFRKVARLPWSLGLKQTGAPTLLEGVNSGSIAIVPPIQPPAGMVSIDQISNQSASSWAETLLQVWDKWWRWILIALIVLLIVIALMIGFTAGWPVALGVAIVCIGAALAAWMFLKNTIAAANAASQVQVSNFTTTNIATVPPRPGFQVTAPGSALSATTSGGTDSAQAAAFRSATSQLFGYFQALPVNPGPLPSLDLTALQTTILSRIDPVLTVPRRIQGLVTLSSDLPWKPVDPLEPIMAAPKFPQPMYAPLRDLSQRYLLPGVDQVPPDTVGLLQANHAFIEAYMAGLNSEMGRELLWFGYPTDQRGSYFRQFWDVSAYVPQPGDPKDPAKLAELLKDIPPINTWPLPAPLGQHLNRTDIVENNLVLLVRGELFKRYPNAIVYAAKAKKAQDGTLVLDDSDERYPIFRGTLSPDMTFLGFNLTAADARGGTAASRHGYFFVFQEQPSEPRFGLEPTPDISPVPHWADLAWTNFATETRSFAPPAIEAVPPSRSSIIANSPWREPSQVFAKVIETTNLPAFLTAKQQPTGTAIVSDTNDPDDTHNKWGVNSAQTAYILLRLPFRILIQATDMLP